MEFFILYLLASLFGTSAEMETWRKLIRHARTSNRSTSSDVKLLYQELLKRKHEKRSVQPQIYFLPETPFHNETFEYKIENNTLSSFSSNTTVLQRDENLDGHPDLYFEPIVQTKETQVLEEPDDILFTYPRKPWLIVELAIAFLVTFNHLTWLIICVSKFCEARVNPGTQENRTFQKFKLPIVLFTKEVEHSCHRHTFYALNMHLAVIGLLYGLINIIGECMKLFHLDHHKKHLVNWTTFHFVCQLTRTTTLLLLCVYWLNLILFCAQQVKQLRIILHTSDLVKDRLRADQIFYYFHCGTSWLFAIMLRLGISIFINFPMETKFSTSSTKLLTTECDLCLGFETTTCTLCSNTTTDLILEIVLTVLSDIFPVFLVFCFSMHLMGNLKKFSQMTNLRQDSFSRRQTNLSKTCWITTRTKTWKMCLILLISALIIFSSHCLRFASQLYMLNEQNSHCSKRDTLNFDRIIPVDMNIVIELLFMSIFPLCIVCIGVKTSKTKTHCDHHRTSPEKLNDITIDEVKPEKRLLEPQNGLDCNQSLITSSATSCSPPDTLECSTSSCVTKVVPVSVQVVSLPAFCCQPCIQQGLPVTTLEHLHETGLQPVEFYIIPSS